MNVRSNSPNYNRTLKAKSDIPIYNQSSEAIGGIQIVKSSLQGIDYPPEKMGAHRDEFYVFFVLTKGNVVVLCDNIAVELNEIGIGFIKPFQVHAAKHISNNTTGYFISIAPFLVPDACLEIFQPLQISEQGKKIDPLFQDDFLNLVSLLHNSFEKQKQNKPQIINGLFNALIYEIANLFQSSERTIPKPRNQSTVISTNFKKLISKSNFLESPSFFAKKLNISASHLTDCVNASTGKPTTYWLQNAMIIEAQRLLYYTENDVKEIAFSLGFKDHSYFSRMFKKLTHETPLAFRKKFRK
ncbi:AraC-type DNA-binding protein [Reichenbachiella agariperforans]|uniref:AraC-type DNA-binding protein n=1 Tax=Reichenbachiella agariperforans TaxID=156994 RepID=A0A1M6UBK4_REIAG|nr:AraC-type DNA-binding protein [Reichenbachiella agariperforans]